MEGDLLTLWVWAVILAFIAFMVWGFGIHDNGVEDKLGLAFGPVILLAAGVVTVLQLIGVIGIW